MKEEEKEAFDNAYHRARRFVYTNARPLELAKWQYHFENGQSSLGGFGDTCLLPKYGWWVWLRIGAGLFESARHHRHRPMRQQSIIWEIGMEREDADHPVIQGILEYLSSSRRV